MKPTSPRHPNVVNLKEVKSRTQEKGTRFGFENKRLGDAAQSQGLGCGWFEIQPGRTAFPHHFHCANEEAIYILEGEGDIRIGEATVKVGAGDYIALPPGPEHAHSLANTGQAPLRYLCISTTQSTEVVYYPDSKKFGAFGSPAHSGSLFSSAWILKMMKDGENVDYYEGERID